MNSYHDQFANILTSTVNAGSQLVVEVTAPLNDVVGSTPVDTFMDAAAGMGHRLVHGHSLDHLPVIFEKFGLKGVGDYMIHGLRDLMSPHGMPLPYAKELAETLQLSTKDSINWLCLNVGDLLSGGVSVGHSIYLTKLIRDAAEAGSIDNALKASIAVAIISKLGFGVASTNPITIASGLYDVGMIGYYAYQKPDLFTPPDPGTQFTRAMQHVRNIAKSTLAGAGSAFATGAILHSFTEDDRDRLKARLQKITFAGAVGGLASGCVAVATTAPIAVSASAIGGYVLGEWLYETQVESDEFTVVPEFLNPT